MHYRRDLNIINVSVSLENLKELNEKFIEIQNSLKKENIQLASGIQNDVHLSYVIRYDNKGMRLSNFEDLEHHFNKAKNIEKINVTVETSENIGLNRISGTYAELNLDQSNQTLNILACHTTNNLENWINNSFLTINDILQNLKNKNGFINNYITILFFKLLWILVSSFISLFIAIRIYKNINLPYSFLIIFIIIFSLFLAISNHLINPTYSLLINKLFPNIKFITKQKNSGWIIQNIINVIVGTVLLFVLGLILSPIFNIINEFIFSILKIK